MNCLAIYCPTCPNCSRLIGEVDKSRRLPYFGATSNLLHCVDVATETYERKTLVLIIDELSRLGIVPPNKNWTCGNLVSFTVPMGMSLAKKDRGRLLDLLNTMVESNCYPFGKFSLCKVGDRVYVRLNPGTMFYSTHCGTHSNKQHEVITSFLKNIHADLKSLDIMISQDIHTIEELSSTILQLRTQSM
jgi:hypothetical protein